MTDDQFRVATAQIIGIAAGSLVDGNPNDSAWVAGNVERYNEQLHRETVEKIEQESGRYAQENQISQPEAEKRLAQAAQYYLDADWRTVMLKDGYVPDEAALDYLGEILAPTGSYYAERQTPKGASLEPGRQYTAQETAALLRDFEFNNLGAFSNTSINSKNFVGFAQGDLSNNYKRFYDRTLKVDSSWSDWSLGNAVGATQGMSASVRGLQNTVSGIANDPVGALEQFASGVGYFAQYPLTTIGNGWDSLVEKGGLSQAYAMQGRHELAGAVAAEQLTDFGIGLIPGERLLALGKVGGATNALDGFVRHDASRGAKGTGTGKAPYASTVSTDAEASMPYAHPVKEAGPKAATNGSGPATGFLEISDAYSSSKAVQGLSNLKPIDFIYDPASQRFIMGRNQFGHDGILDAGKIPSSDAIVGGGIWKENGVLRTYEWSGHYGMNWTPELREQFKSFMSSHGMNVTHTPGISR